MTLTVLRAADHQRMPWKNGGGETLEVAVFPQDSTLNHFDWRVSMADVATDGPFSTFIGVNRTLTVLTGAGIILNTGGAEETHLPQFRPFAFSGETPVTARLTDGPIRDLNIMTREATHSHKVTPITKKTLPSAVLKNTTRFVAATAPCLCGVEYLNNFDIACISEDETSLVVTPIEGTIALYIEITSIP